MVPTTPESGWIPVTVILCPTDNTQIHTFHSAGGLPAAASAGSGANGHHDVLCLGQKPRCRALLWGFPASVTLCHWKYSGTEDMPIGRLLKQYFPSRAMNVASKDDFRARRICQNPELASIAWTPLERIAPIRVCHHQRTPWVECIREAGSFHRVVLYCTFWHPTSLAGQSFCWCLFPTPNIPFRLTSFTIDFLSFVSLITIITSFLSSTSHSGCCFLTVSLPGTLDAFC